MAPEKLHVRLTPLAPDDPENDGLDYSHVLLAPGQGNQRVGMGIDLAVRFRAAPYHIADEDDVWKVADKALFPQLGRHLTDIVWNTAGKDPREAEAELELTENAQPAVITDVLARKAALEKTDQLAAPGWHTGNSVGLIAALINAGSLAIDGGVQLTKGRGDVFRFAIDNGPKTTMAAFVNVEREVLQELRNPEGRYRLVTCLVNTDKQTVLGGPEEDVRAAVADLKERGIKGVYQLQVDAAFHSKYMEPAVPLWTEVVNSVTIEAPKYGMVVGGSTVTPLTTPEAIRAELIAQLTHTERYGDAIHFLRGQGVTTMTELNSSTRLTKMNIELIDSSLRSTALTLPGSDKLTIIAHRLVVPVNRDFVRNWYLSWVADRQGVSFDQLNEGMLFVEDAGLESEDLMALRADVMARFGMLVPDEEADKNNRVSMAVDATYGLITGALTY